MTPEELRGYLILLQVLISLGIRTTAEIRAAFVSTGLTPAQVDAMLEVVKTEAATHADLSNKHALGLVPRLDASSDPPSVPLPEHED